MNTNLYRYSNIVIKKTFDADFQTKMEGVKFSTTPREVISLKDMEFYYDSLLFKGVDDYE